MNMRKVFEVVNGLADLPGQNNLLRMSVCIIIMVLLCLALPIAWAAGITLALVVFKEISNYVLRPKEDFYFRKVFTWLRIFYSIFGTMLGQALVMLIQHNYGIR